MLHVIDCKFYTTEGILNKKSGNRFKRDNIYFVIFKTSNNISFTVELSQERKNYYFPINASYVKNCKEIELTLINKERIESSKNTRKVSWSS